MRQLEDLFSVFPLIETERLILRQLTLEDAEDFFVCHSDPEAFRYSRHSEETSLQSATHTLNRLLKWYQDRFMLCWRLYSKRISASLEGFRCKSGVTYITLQKSAIGSARSTGERDMPPKP